MIRCNSDSRHTGGVVLYIKRTIQFTVVSNISYKRNWMLAIKIISGYNKCILGVLYRSPNNNLNTFLEFLEDWNKVNRYLSDIICLSHKNHLIK